MTRRQTRIASRLVFLLPVAALGIAMLLAGAARTLAAWQGQSIPDDLLGGLPTMAISLVPLGACALIAWVIARRPQRLPPPAPESRRVSCPQTPPPAWPHCSPPSPRRNPSSSLALHAPGTGAESRARVCQTTEVESDSSPFVRSTLLESNPPPTKSPSAQTLPNLPASSETRQRQTGHAPCVQQKYQTIHHALENLVDLRTPVPPGQLQGAPPRQASVFGHGPLGLKVVPDELKHLQ